MKRFAALYSASIVLLCSFNHHSLKSVFPWKSAGLTEQQAAAHLLGRFTYGATTEDINAATKMGLENWFAQQLEASLPDDSLQSMLNQYPDLKLSNAEIAERFPGPGQLAKLVKNSMNSNDSSGNIDYKKERQKLLLLKGLKTRKQLLNELYSQKILRAVYSNNQLQEVMTEFWFNHFNVAVTKNICMQMVPNYERDVIRPNALGKFSDLLIATAKSPAMLLYLDNFSSSCIDSSRRLLFQRTGFMDSSGNKPGIKKRLSSGLNENYARELMELHTLGVDGGYTQQDVTQVARMLTGWTIYPSNAMNNQYQRLLKLPGLYREGDFLFINYRHDNREKTVLGKKFPAGGGYKEGVELLNMLAHYPSTAKFISKEIAVRFVSDNPPQSLVDKMAKTFTDKNGDIKQVLITMVSSPEFWSSDALRAKTKSPFEYAISAVRSLHAQIQQPLQLNAWITKMGEPMYAYLAPTGYPDKAQYWVNSGALLNRMNFGLALADNRIPGVYINLLALNNGYEPGSAQEALTAYSKMILPQRNLDKTIQQLTPLLTDPKLSDKVIAAANKQNMANKDNNISGNDADEDDSMQTAFNKTKETNNTKVNDDILAQVVGIIVGSPEFQRR